MAGTVPGVWPPNICQIHFSWTQMTNQSSCFQSTPSFVIMEQMSFFWCAYISGLCFLVLLCFIIIVQFVIEALMNHSYLTESQWLSHCCGIEYLAQKRNATKREGIVKYWQVVFCGFVTDGCLPSYIACPLPVCDVVSSASHPMGSPRK